MRSQFFLLVSLIGIFASLKGETHSHCYIFSISNLDMRKVDEGIREIESLLRNQFDGDLGQFDWSDKVEILRIERNPKSDKVTEVFLKNGKVLISYRSDERIVAAFINLGLGFEYRATLNFTGGEFVIEKAGIESWVQEPLIIP